MDMNIFRVLASGETFSERLLSCFLGWLMHPKMDHGLGMLFIERFIKKVAGDNDPEIIRQLMESDDLRCSLEEHVGIARIDIVYFFGDYVIAIENKLYDGSVSEGQLLREYTGLCRRFPEKKIIVTYLVPYKSIKTIKEYDSLTAVVSPPHGSALVTWSETIQEIIDSILEDDVSKKIKPLSDDVKFTLESLSDFIENNFRGYDFIERSVSDTQSDYPRLTFNELKEKTDGYVGVARGLPGLFRLTGDEIQRENGFQFDDSPDCTRQYWLPIDEFLAIAEHRINGSMLPTGFRMLLDSKSIYELVCQADNENIYVGIKGGERALLAMEQNEIESKSWKITIGDQPNSQWISGSRFKEIYDTKFPS